MFGKKKKKKRAAKSRDYYEEISNIDPDTKGAIVTILIFMVAILSIFSMFGMAGRLGGLLSSGLAYLFGWADWAFVLLLLFMSWALFKSSSYKLGFIKYLGFSLIIITIASLLHFFVKEFDFREITSAGKGGGVLGYVISQGLLSFLGHWGSLLVLLCLFIIGIFLSFNTSFKNIIDRAKALGILKEKLLPEIDNNINSEDIEEEDFSEQEDDNEDEEGDFSEQEDEMNSEDIEEEDFSEQEQESDEGGKGSHKMRKIRIPIELLTKSNSKPDSGDVKANMDKIEKTFNNFGIEVSMGEVNVGPSVTQYTLRPADGVKLSRLLPLQNDLSLALAAHPLRMEAPIPGKSLVGLEVPNHSIATVKFREILESDAYKKRKGNLQISLGKDVSGKSLMADLSKMPHLLVAGATGSGKSVCINNIILSLMYQNSPDELKFILIDPKRVELAPYNDIPYLLTPVIDEPDKTINALRWAVKEMHERYKTLKAAGKRDIASYNNSVIVEPMPYIVVIVDEFASLMSTAAKEVEAAVVSLAQMARAVGIHLVLATQRPSVDVITGLIKANITSRIAFSVASAQDSRTIIDTSGADKLLGKGDMLFTTAELSKPKRIQGAFVTDEEINAVVAYAKDKVEPNYINEIVEKTSSGGVVGFSSGNGDDDELAMEAKEIVLRAGKASATLLQRRLRVGYARAARLLDILEEMGIVGPAEGSKAREVLISQEDLEENFSSALDGEEYEEDVAEEENN